MGRTPEQIKERNRKRAEKSREQYKDPAFAARKAAEAKARREANPEEYRSRARARYHADPTAANARRADYRRRHREEQNAKQRAYYHANKERIRELIYAGKDRRDPTRGLYGVFRQFESGAISLDQLIEQVGRRIIRLNERVKSRLAGDDSQALRPGPSADSGSLRAPDRRVDEDEA